MTKSLAFPYEEKQGIKSSEVVFYYYHLWKKTTLTHVRQLLTAGRTADRHYY